MGTRVRAAVVDKAGAAPEIVEVTLSDPAPDEVLVRVSATGVCHTDVAWQSGQLFDSFPVVLGHETAGVVEAVGTAVSRVAPGDQVLLSLAHHCGHCEYCETSRPMLCSRRTEGPPRIHRGDDVLIQGFGSGGFAEAVLVRADSLVAVPDGVPLEVAAVMGCAVATGFGAVLNIAEVRPGTRVLVFGAGGVGLCVAMAARLAGAQRIVVADPKPDRRAGALKIGATDVAESTEEALREIEPDGYDYTFECSGHTSVMALAVALCRRGGDVVLIGAPTMDAQLAIPALDFIVSQRRLHGCLTGNLRPNVDFDSYFRLYRDGRLDLDALISGSLPLDRIVEGFQRNADGVGIRTIITMGS